MKIRLPFTQIIFLLAIGIIINFFVQNSIGQTTPKTNNETKPPAKVDIIDLSAQKEIVANITWRRNAESNKIHVTIPLDASQDTINKLQAILLELEKEGENDYTLYKMPLFIPLGYDKKQFEGKISLSEMAFIAYRGGVLGLVPISVPLKESNPSAYVKNYIAPRKAEMDRLEDEAEKKSKPNL